MHLCRTCLSAEDLRDIFADSDVNRRKDQLTTVTGVKISPNDGLPQKICNACSKLVDSAVKLRETSAYSEKMLFQNGFQYSEQKLMTKKEKNDIKIKKENCYNDNDCDFHDYHVVSKVKHEYDSCSVITKPTCGTKKKHKMKKTLSKQYNTKCSTKTIPKTSTYNVDTTDLLAAVSNDNKESIDIINNITSMIPNDPSVDEDIQKIINNIESQGKLHSITKAVPSGDLVQIYDIIDSKIELIDTESNKRKCKNKRIKKISLAEELIEHLKKEEEKKPLQKKPKTSSVNLDEIYNIIDTKIDTLDVKDKTSSPTKDKTVKKTSQKPRWSAERHKTFWSLAVEPFERNERVQCKICHKFTKYHCFTRHAATHFEPEFTCEVCGMKLMSKKNLADHQQRKHGATKNFACAQCDYRSVLPAELQNHIRRVHTGERPFICDLCSESFYQRRCLVAHMKCHYAEKKYQCDRCSNMFKSQGQLTAHYNRYHIMRYTFYCDHCSYQVSKSSKVKDHLTKVHGIPRDKQAPIKFFKERREESLYGETNTKHLRKPEDVVKKLSFKY